LRARACSIYTANIIITLAAAEDPRGAALHGVQTLAKVSLYPMQTLFDPPTDANDAHYGPGTPLAFEGADKRDLLVVISVLDVRARVQRLQRRLSRACPLTPVASRRCLRCASCSPR
jgi:hypothetical protein